jgi:hypothetical protein
MCWVKCHVVCVGIMEDLCILVQDVGSCEGDVSVFNIVVLRM